MPRFADFSIYELEIARGHYIGGFGRIVDLHAAALLTDIADAQALVDAEPDIVAHMNSDHADAVALYATELAGCPPGNGAWRASIPTAPICCIAQARPASIFRSACARRRSAHDACFAGAAGARTGSRRAVTLATRIYRPRKRSCCALQHFAIAMLVIATSALTWISDAAIAQL